MTCVPEIDDSYHELAGYDKHRAGTRRHGRGVPALSLVTPYSFRPAELATADR